MNKVKDFQDLMQRYNCCVVMPTFNNAPKLQGVLESLVGFTEKVIVVNDGSADDTTSILKQFPQITVLSYVRNMGKGYALLRGFKKALELDYNYAITIDSDGQHRPEELPEFLNKLDENPGSLIVGSRNMEQDGVPGSSNFGHRFSNFWYKLETGIDLPDTQSGYRLYPIRRLHKMKFYTTKYELELEILVRAAWKGIPVIPMPIDVIYPEDRITHFRKIPDFTRISMLNSIFVLITFFYIKPKNFLANFKKENRKAFIKKHVMLSTEPNSRIALALGLGIFMGIVPIWGYQIVTGLALAHATRLNKFWVVAASNISIPPFIPFILFGSYHLGGFILGKPFSMSFDQNLNLENIGSDVYQYLVGAVVLSVFAGLLTALTSYLLLLLFRKEPVGV